MQSLHDCDEKWFQGHLYSPVCGMDKFDNGFNSHIRGTGTGLIHGTKVFPGVRQLGNEAGANGPIYIDNPDQGLIIALNRRYQGPGSRYLISDRIY